MTNSRKRYVPVALVALLGVLGTVIVADYVRETRHAGHVFHFTKQAQAHVAAISFAFRQHINRLSDLQAYFKTTHSASRDRFATFAKSLLKGASGVQAFEWIPRVPEAKRRAFEETARFHGYAGFEFKERNAAGELVRAASRPEYYPVYFLEPYAGNLKAIGFDLASQPDRKRALIRSRDSGDLVLTRRITLVQESGTQFGILAFEPVYRRDMRQDTPEERARSIEGFALAVFRIGDLVNSAISRFTDQAPVTITLLDRNAPSDQQVLYESHPHQPVPAEADADTTTAHRMALPVDLRVNDSMWEVVFAARPGHPLLETDWVVFLVVAAGLAMTGMLATIATIQVNRETLTRRLVEDRTSELRDSEERFRDFAGVSADWFWEMDSDLRFSYISGRFTELTGLSSVKLIGQRLEESDLSPEIDELVRPHLENLRQRQPMRGFDQPHTGADGRTIYLSMSANPVFAKNGDFWGYRGIGRDVTEAKKVERLKSEFVSTVSHELRTPLTSIKGSLGMIHSGVLGDIPARADSMVTIAYKNTERLITLVNDILDMEKLESGRMEFRFEVQTLGDLVGQTIDINKGLADQHGVTFAVDDRAPGGRVRADGDRIGQVMANLLSNAAKFSPTGETVTVSVERFLGSLRVSVSDKGPGIPDDFRDKIFDRFAQADSSDTRQQGGTGLGLSVSKSIVERHGGVIGFQSAPETGTTFHFDLPEIVAGAGDAVAMAAPSDREKRILLCEDDADLVEMLSMLLEGAADVVPATTVREAERRLQDERFAGVIIDILLPDGSGLELLERINGNGKDHTPTIIFSSQEVSVDVARKVDAAFLKSRTSNQELVDTVKALIADPGV